MSLLLLLRSILGVPSTVLDPIAAALVTKISALSVTPTIKGVKWDPGFDGIPKLPAGLVGMPRIERENLAESQLGSNDWNLEYPVALCFDLSKASYSQAQAVEVVEAFIKAIDADHTLGNVVQDATVLNSEPIPVDDEARPMIIYRCTVAVYQLV